MFEFSEKWYFWYLIKKCWKSKNCSYYKTCWSNANISRKPLEKIFRKRLQIGKTLETLSLTLFLYQQLLFWFSNFSPSNSKTWCTQNHRILFCTFDRNLTKTDSVLRQLFNTDYDTVPSNTRWPPPSPTDFFRNVSTLFNFQFRLNEKLPVKAINSVYRHFFPELTLHNFIVIFIFH